MENYDDALGMFGISYIDENGQEIGKFQPDNNLACKKYSINSGRKIENHKINQIGRLPLLNELVTMGTYIVN